MSKNQVFILGSLVMSSYCTVIASGQPSKTVFVGKLLTGVSHFKIGCLILGDFLVDSLVLADRLL